LAVETNCWCFRATIISARYHSRNNQLTKSYYFLNGQKIKVFTAKNDELDIEEQGIYSKMMQQQQHRNIL